MMEPSLQDRRSRAALHSIALLLAVTACVHHGASAAEDHGLVPPPNCNLPTPVPAGLSGQPNGFSNWIAANLHFTGGGQHLPRGASNTPLDISAEARARKLAISCITGGNNSYFVAEITYYKSQTQFSGWPTWTPTSGSAYLYYYKDQNSASGVSYAVYMLSPTDTVPLAHGPLAVCNHGDDSPSNAQWGWHHIEGCPDRGPYDRSAGGTSAPGPRQSHGSYFLDAAGAAWVTCDQGCCTSDNMFQM